MSLDAPYDRRRRLAERIRAQRDTVATRVTAEFLDRHPDWVRRFGDDAHRHGVQDARYHVEFLAGAIEGGSATAFAEYARWTAGVLDARGMQPRFLIENLEQIRDQLVRQLDEDDRNVVQRVIDDACGAVRTEPSSRTADAGAPADERSARLYLQAILAGQRRAALNIARDALDRGWSVPDVYVDMLQPAQYEVGRLWERNEITVAREHMATAITQYVIAQLYPQMDVPEPIRGAAIVTGVAGELHQLGANMVADVLEAAGWSVRFLGTQLPQRDIVRALEEHDADLLAVSATMVFNVPRVAALLDAARQARGAELRVMVGGSAFRVNPELWREIGADGFGRDLRAAVEVAAGLRKRAD